MVGDEGMGVGGGDGRGIDDMGRRVCGEGMDEEIEGVEGGYDRYVEYMRVDMVDDRVNVGGKNVGRNMEEVVNREGIVESDGGYWGKRIRGEVGNGGDVGVERRGWGGV